jgi:hypothetical protein
MAPRQDRVRSSRRIEGLAAAASMDARGRYMWEFSIVLHLGSEPGISIGLEDLPPQR